MPVSPLQPQDKISKNSFFARLRTAHIELGFQAPQRPGNDRAWFIYMTHFIEHKMPDFPSPFSAILALQRLQNVFAPHQIPPRIYFARGYVLESRMLQIATPKNKIPDLRSQTPDEWQTIYKLENICQVYWNALALDGQLKQ
jgi:hypothetical protein